MIASFDAGSMHDKHRAPAHGRPIMTVPFLRRGSRSIPRSARRLWWLIADLARLWQRAPELTIDPRRLNAELRRSARAGLDDDMFYRERVKQRMRDGARCAYPPLIDRSRPRSFDAFRRGGWMSRPSAASARSPRTPLVEWYGL